MINMERPSLDAAIAIENDFVAMNVGDIIHIWRREFNGCWC